MRYVPANSKWLLVELHFDFRWQKVTGSKVIWVNLFPSQSPSLLRIAIATVGTIDASENLSVCSGKANAAAPTSSVQLQIDQTKDSNSQAEHGLSHSGDLLTKIQAPRKKQVPIFPAGLQEMTGTMLDILPAAACWLLMCGKKVPLKNALDSVCLQALHMMSLI